jgi:hypothetical protein
MSAAPEPLAVRQLTRDELDLVVEWAAAEGWNPGTGDAQIFWDTDAEGFVGVHAGLGAVTAGQPVFLDVPENNAGSLALADHHGMTEVFGCARMYLGTPPPLPWDRIFGVTTFELG